MNRAELLATVRARRAEFEAGWAGAAGEQLTARPGPQSDWSVKDLIAHMSYWAGRVLDDVRLGVSGGTPAEQTESDAVINARVFYANRDRPLDSVLAEWAQVNEEFLAFVEAAPEAVLLDRERFLWAGGTLAAYIASEFVDHYDAHLPDLLNWQARLPEQS